MADGSADAPTPMPQGVDPLATPLATSGLPSGRRIARRGARLGLVTVGDLLFHLPRAHRDLRRICTVAELALVPEKELATAALEVVRVLPPRRGGRGIPRTVATLRDATGTIDLTWFGAGRFIERRLLVGQSYLVAGRVRKRGWQVTLENAEFGPLEGEGSLHVGRLVPVYRLTRGLGARELRQGVREALDRYAPLVEDYLTPEERAGRIGLAAALEQAHFPADEAARAAALDRLAFDELLALQVGMVARGRERDRIAVPPLALPEAGWERCIAGVEAGLAAGLPPDEDGSRPERAPLTADQAAAAAAIRSDLARGRPMMRLLQGDVGSGKTAVAALAMALVAETGGQSALLAPTDLLARQHAATLGRLLAPLGHDVVLVSAAEKPAARREAASLAAAPVPAGTGGTTRGLCFVGTHALLGEALAFADLRLAIVDEQHRFGVEDRDALEAKGLRPHLLLMTATPIPRTLGQILHADLDVSDLRAAPSGRQRTVTAVRAPDELVRRRDGQAGALVHLAREVAAGRRGFVIAPLVHPPEPDPDLPPPPGPPPTDLGAAVALLERSWPEACRLAGVGALPLRLAVVHGQMKAADRDREMARFRDGEIDIVAGTTVLEVGVDVPLATVIVILDAERFGIAQLHQLRGRVGRGRDRGGCVLVSAAYPDPSARDDALDAAALSVRRRLDALRESTDGFALAELDLELRGEGRLLGLEQSGLPPLRVATLGDPRHRKASTEARAVAERIVDPHGRVDVAHAGLARALAGGWLRRVGAGDVVAGEELDA